MTLVEAICEADERDDEVTRLEDALWASELSGFPRPSLRRRRDAALRAAIAAWETVHAMSSLIEDEVAA